MNNFEKMYEEYRGYAPRFGMVSPDLKHLVKGFYTELAASPISLVLLRESLIDLLQFLTTPEGRTSPNCRLVDYALALGDWELPDLPTEFADVIADMGGALHDTIDAPEIAYNFDATPEQLLDRVLRIEAVS